MDDVKIGAGCCVGAGALVTAGTVTGPGRLLVGVPAKDIGAVKENLASWLEEGTSYYTALPPRLFKGLREISLPEVVK